jgi:RimJ/RimL family protein N-acetyltransferase
MAVVGRPITRLVTRDDAEALAVLVSSNRHFTAPWDPIRAEEFFTVDGQVASIEDALAQHDQGIGLPHVIVDGSGDVVGRITLHGISRGAFQSCGRWQEHILFQVLNPRQAPDGVDQAQTSKLRANP